MNLRRVARRLTAPSRSEQRLTHFQYRAGLDHGGALAAHLQISTRHLINLRKAGLPFIQLGASVRYDLAEVEAYLRTNRRLSSHIARQQRRKALGLK